LLRFDFQFFLELKAVLLEFKFQLLLDLFFFLK
jgi:hypothetical protein